MSDGDNEGKKKKRRRKRKETVGNYYGNLKRLECSGG